MMIVADTFPDDIGHVIWSLARAVQDVAFTGSVLLTVAMVGSVLWYAKRRPQNAELTWGQAMFGALYVTFILVWFFGIVPDRWLAYAQGTLAMRGDAILAGPGSTGWLKDFPVVISKAAVSDFVVINIYGIGMVATVAVWAIWQKRGQQTEEVETSNYGRPLVKA